MDLVKIFEDGLLVLFFAAGIVAVASTATFVVARAYDKVLKGWGVMGLIPFVVIALFALIMAIGLLANASKP